MNVKSIRRENARALAKSVGGIHHFALKLNKAQSQVSHIIGKSPIKNIGDKMATEIELAFDKPPGWLDQEHYQIEKNQAVYYIHSGQSAVLCQQVPLITWEEAKKWHHMVYGYQPKKNQSWMVTTADVGPLAFALQVQGNSMESASGITFPHGVMIVADPDQVVTHESFIVVSVRQGTEATLRQLVSDGHKRYLKPLNPNYPILEYTIDTTVYGVVKQIMVNFIE